MDDVLPAEVLVSESRAVRPRHLVSLGNLLFGLLAAGATNCMLYPSQFEASVSRFLAECPLRTSISSASYANRLTTHIQVTFNFLRRLAQEDLLIGSPRSHYSKTASFRKAATPPEWILIHQMIAKVVLNVPWSSPMASPTATPRAVPKQTHEPRQHLRR